MATTTIPHSEQDTTGLFRIATGAGVGLAAALLAIVIPVGFLLVASYEPGGFLSLHQTAFLDAIGLLILAGALLFLFSLLIYRNAFAHLRKVDRRFIVASVLCLIGTLGFILLLVAAVVVVGSSSSLLSCINNQPTHALTCLRSGQPLGAYTGLIGFWLGWVGGVGIVLGLSAGSSGSRTERSVSVPGCTRSSCSPSSDRSSRSSYRIRGSSSSSSWSLSSHSSRPSSCSEEPGR